MVPPADIRKISSTKMAVQLFGAEQEAAKLRQVRAQAAGVVVPIGNAGPDNGDPLARQRPA